MSKLLIDEHPLMVLPSLATAIGLHESMFLQQLHYWIDRSGKERDGREWVYNSYEDWSKQFPWWSSGTIRRIVNRLKKQGLIVTTDKYNAIAIDKTLWYAIDYDVLAGIMDDSTPEQVEAQTAEKEAAATVENDSPYDQNVQTKRAECTDQAREVSSPCDQSDHTNNQRLSTETTTETTEERGEAADVAASVPVGSSLPSPLAVSICDVMGKVFGFLSEKKRGAVVDAAARLQEAGMTPAQVGGFRRFWMDEQPLGPQICATAPHLGQVLEWMPAAVAWLEEQAAEAAESRDQAAESRIQQEQLAAEGEAWEALVGDVPEDDEDAWEWMLAEMRMANPAVFERWLRGCRLIDVHDDVYVVMVPNAQTLEYLRVRLNGQVVDRLIRTTHRMIELRYVLPSELRISELRATDGRLRNEEQDDE